MNKELYNKYKHLPLKAGHKWMMLGVNKSIEIVIDEGKNFHLTVSPGSHSMYFDGCVYDTAIWDNFLALELPKEPTLRPMTFKEAVKHLWELQQKGPVLISHKYNSIEYTSCGLIQKEMFKEVKELGYSTDLGETWNKFEVEE